MSHPYANHPTVICLAHARAQRQAKRLHQLVRSALADMPSCMRVPEHYLLPASRHLAESPLISRTAQRAASGASGREPVTIHLHSPPIWRLVRRDFAIVTARLYIRTRHPVRLALAQELVGEMANEARRLDALTIGRKRPSGASGEAVTLALVTSEAKSLLDALLMADQSLSRLAHAGLSKTAIRAHSRAFFRAYGRLKHFVVGTRPRRPWQQAQADTSPAPRPEMARSSVRRPSRPPAGQSTAAKRPGSNDRKPLPKPRQ